MAEDVENVKIAARYILVHGPNIMSCCPPLPSSQNRHVVMQPPRLKVDVGDLAGAYRPLGSRTNPALISQNRDLRER